MSASLLHSSKRRGYGDRKILVKMTLIVNKSVWVFLYNRILGLKMSYKRNFMIRSFQATWLLLVFPAFMELPVTRGRWVIHKKRKQAR